MDIEHSVSLAGDATSIIFVATNILSRQTRISVAPKAVFCRDKHVFVATKLFCCDKNDTCGGSRQ